VGSNRRRQLKRERRQLDRRKTAQQSGARETQAQQKVAAAQLDLARRHRRHMQAYALYGIAAVIAIGHFFEHAQVFQLMSPGLEDLLIGWPMAAFLALVGAIRYGT
jgi:hypothetical protein